MKKYDLIAASHKAKAAVKNADIHEIQRIPGENGAIFRVGC